jgi:hypothetical protein
MNLRLAILLTATWLGLAPAAASAASRLLLVPLQGLTRAREARELLTTALEVELTSRGYAVVRGEPVEAVLYELRIRYLDSLTPGQVALLLHKTGADAAVVGTVLDYSPAPDASLSLLLQVVDPTGILWSRIYALRASQSVGPLGEVIARTPDEVAALLMMRDLADLPRAGSPFPPPPTGRTGELPRVFRAPLEATAGRPRICVLPLANRSQSRTAGKVAEAGLLDALAREPSVEVVPPALLRSAVAGNAIRSLSNVTPAVAELLSATVGTSLFLQGAVLRFEPGVPEVELYLSLTDLKAGKVLWSGLHRRRGSDYEDWLAPGTVKDPALLLARTAEELVAAFTDRSARRTTKPEVR